MNPTLHDIQLLLKQRGYALGSSGPGKDGVDGQPGDLTYAAILAELSKAGNVSAPSVFGPLTVRIVLEVLGHEALVQEAYKDSEGVWTWAGGVTNASGHEVFPRYKDNPQPLLNCVAVTVWLMRTKYLRDVVAAFGSFVLSEAQLAAALSWHWNTGAIGRSDWVGLVKAGKLAEARAFILSHYLNGGDLQKRREQEAALFFDGKWSNDGKTTVYEVAKPSYSPKWSSAKRVDISALVLPALGDTV